MTRLYKLTLLCSLLVLVALVASRSARGAETTAPANANPMAVTVDSQYGAWEQSGPTSPGTLDISQCRFMSVGDINGDGLSDLICPRYLGEFIPTTYTYVQRATPTGFSEWQQASPRNDDDNFTLIYCANVMVGDVNGDMLTDLICPYDHGQASTTTYVQLANGTGFGDWQAFSPTQPPFTFELAQCRILSVGDMNGDGFTDVFCPYVYPDGSTTTFVQLGDPGGFSGWQASGPNNPPGTFNMNSCYDRVKVGDVNGDGNSDLICAYDYGGTTTTFVKRGGDAGFSGWEASGPTFMTFDLTKCQPPRVGDANGDGLTDLICPYNIGGASMTVYVQLAGPTGFSEWQQSGPTNPAGTFDLNQCGTRQVGDVNGDGVTDLICPYDYGGTTTTFVKEGSAEGYSAWLPSAYEHFDFDLTACHGIYPGDLNGDDRTDLICTVDYGESSTATFVQLQEVTSFDVFAPVFVR